MAHKPKRTLRNELCHLKDKHIENDRSGVVYGLDCNDCSAIYVGETGRQVKERMKEHRDDIIKKKPVSKVQGVLNHFAKVKITRSGNLT